MNRSFNNLLVLVLLLGMGCSFNKTTQLKGDYLFSIGGEKHFSDEFNYAFAKNNQESEHKVDSINNYLDLYINFRLKVKAAKEAGYDTTASFKKEFGQYKSQLDESYLSPKKEQEALIKEAYDRSLWDVKAAHILVNLAPNALPDDTLKAYNKIMSYRNRLQNGENFNQLARQVSDDPSAKTNGGELGYFSALQMVYPFETMVYSTPVGEISMPVRTQFGYHILKVEDKRKNEGKVQVAHIMIRSTTKNAEEFQTKAKEKAYKIDSLLKNGGDWNELCKTYSEDPNSVYNNGLLNPFGRGQIVPEFENAAFELRNLGDISEPVQTQFGWHIIKLIKRIPVGTYEEEHDNLARRVSRDSRSSMPHEEMVKSLKSKNGFVNNDSAVKKLLNPSNPLITKAKWSFTREQKGDTTLLFSIGDTRVTLGQFIVALDGKPFNGANDSKTEMKRALTNYSDTLVTNYVKKHLSETYPDYKYLLNEYYDGILLFSIMEDSVWNKSMNDSLGLKKYYEGHSGRYLKESKDTTLFVSTSEATIREIMAKSMGEDKDWDELKIKLLEEYNISPLNLHVVSKNEPVWNKINLEPGALDGKPFERDGQWFWLRIGDKQTLQPFANVKGKVIADYQSYLDNLWVERLKVKYPVEINKKQLKTVYAHFKANN